MRLRRLSSQLTTKANSLVDQIVNALRVGLADPESDNRYAVIDVLTLVANPQDFEPVLVQLSEKLASGLSHPETITDTLFVVNFLLGTNLTVDDFIDENGQARAE